jgi:flavorubredoxin
MAFEPIVLKEEKNHKFVWLSVDEAEMEKGILTNQYLLVVGDKGMILDPGGPLVFERVFEAVTKFVDPNNLEYIFLSHEDPYIMSGMQLLLGY